MTIQGASFRWGSQIATSSAWTIGLAMSGAGDPILGDIGVLVFGAALSLGLVVFGVSVAGQERAPELRFREIEARYGGALALFQILAGAVTISAAVAVVAGAVGLHDGAVLAALGCLAALTIGHVAEFPALPFVSLLGFAVAAITAAAAYFAAPGAALAAHPSAGAGMVAAIAVTAFLSPWLDVRQWQAAAAVRREGGDIARTFIIGAAAAFALNFMVWRAFSAPTEIRALGSTIIVAAALFIPTFASAYSASRRQIAIRGSQDSGGILALIAPSVAGSPFWIFLSAAMLSALFTLVVVFSEPSAPLPGALAAAVVAGPAATLACECFGAKKAYDPVFLGLTGVAAAIIFAVGVATHQQIWLAFVPALVLFGAAPALRVLFSGTNGRRRVGALNVTSPASPSIPVPNWEKNQSAPPGSSAGASHGFEGNWYVFRAIATYDDTNSTGNVYFANYFRWVGKTRELFLNACIPDFDVKRSGYFILTKSFDHEFRRECREFEEITTRVRIAKYNRKFVTLEHTLHDGSGALLGRGEQVLIFVDAEARTPLDIPGQVMRGFLPYAPSKKTEAISEVVPV